MTIAMRVAVATMLTVAALIAGCGGGDADEGATTRESNQAAAPGSSALPIKIPKDLWKPPAGATPAGGNYVYLQSEAGDPVGQGRSYLYTHANAIFTVGALKAQFGIDVQGDERWNSSFAGPDSLNNVKVGYYPNLQRIPFHDPTKGGLSWTGSTINCNTVNGWFAVDSVTYNASELIAFELRFEQKCDGGTPALRGKVRWSASDVVLPPGPVNPPPANLWRAPVDAAPATGSYLYLQGDRGNHILSDEARLYTQANSVISVIADAAYAQFNVRSSMRWSGQFQAMVGLASIQPGYYGGVKGYGPHNPAKGGMRVSGSTGCSDLTGWFVVDGVTYTGTTLTAIEMRFEQFCDGNPAGLRGQFRWSVNDTTAAPGPVSPPPVDLWQPPSGSTPATGNLVYLQSDTDDYIGSGQTYTYTNANAIVTVSAAGGHLRVFVNGNQSWSGDFQAMNSLSALQPGYYGNLERYPVHNPAIGGLSWGGEGRGCNTLTGWFVVDSVSYVNDALSAIDLRFEQHCEGRTPALRGKVRWSVNDTTVPSGPVNPPPADLWQPLPGATPANGNFVYLQSDIGDYIGQGRIYTYTNANATLSVSATGGHLMVSVNGAEWWVGNFQTMIGLSELQPGYYGNLQRYSSHNPAFGGLDWYGQNRGCNRLSGWFVVDSVSYVSGVLSAIDLRFEQHCENGTPALRGQLRWAR